MKSLLKKGKYNSGSRPSEHNIGKRSFFNDHGGSISPSVLTFANTSSNDAYLQACRKNNIKPHPARMSISLVEFFIKFLTDEDDLILDPFAGSNTTGRAAQNLNRGWLSIELNNDFVDSSQLRFLP